MTRITIVDYGMGNLGSIRNMLKRVGVDSDLAVTAADILAADKLLLPGVGAFDTAMQRIESAGLREALDRKARVECVPVLGICLGMQLLTRSSEEGVRQGLGWIRASTYRFQAFAGVKVPHMGWNLAQATRSSVLTRDLPIDPRFYFVHSYFVRVDDPADSVLRTTHGVTFDAAIEHGNILGAQLHPEKSHRFGMQILHNFARI